jgi:hypothetical protein
MIVTSSDAARFRTEAETCRRQAEKAISQIQKEASLKMASEWTKLAESASAKREK